MRRILISGIAIPVIAIAGIAILRSGGDEPRTGALVQSVAQAPKAQEPEPQPRLEPEPLPKSFMLDVPFVVQAPLADWSPPFNRNCEETSLFMVHLYLEGKPAPAPQESAEELLRMVEFEKQAYADYRGTAAEYVGKLAQSYYGYKARVATGVTLDDIKREIMAGNPVIVPTNGQLLKNPNFKGKGPPYHMVVLKGYNETGFIANDPGTRRGEDFFYSNEIMKRALVDRELTDWNTDTADALPPAMLIVTKR